MSSLPKAPCVGDNVVWYPHGNTSQEPFAATVTARLSDECITLYTLSPTGRREPMLNVKHVNHPDHINAPQGLKRWGAWDLVGEHEKRKNEERKVKEAEHKKAVDEAVNDPKIIIDAYADPDEDELRVIRFARDLAGTPARAKAVADKIGGGMTHQRVNAILRKFPHYLAGNLPDEVVEAQV